VGGESTGGCEQRPRQSQRAEKLEPKTGAHDGVQAAYDRVPGAQGLSRSTSLRAENDEKTNSALGLAGRESADQETRKFSSIKNERKCDFAL
jgi:hypothetical protein